MSLLRYDSNIEKDLKEVGSKWVDWMGIGVAVNTGFLKTVMNPSVPL
jgi:hypothetical protein